MIMMMSLPVVSPGRLYDDDDHDYVVDDADEGDDENEGGDKDDVDADADADDDVTSCCLTCLSVCLSCRKLQGDVQTDRPLPGGHRL